VLAAATGDEAVESYATSLDTSSFAVEVAAHDEPIQIDDVKSTKLEVPDAMRASGIRALLGVRLPRRRDLLGVMYVGISEPREFTSREIERLASLGERLSLHLENARLFAALHDKVESLALERSLREHFVTTLAHDLRGPLSAARLAAELLARQPASLDERRDLALRLDRNIMRVDHMIRDLLDANRIRAGERLPLRLDACDLVALAHRVAEEARAIHGDRFSVEGDTETVRGIWSEDELHRALWNLVTNAVKYGAPRHPITITVARGDPLARISVHNSGTPIPAADHARIFDAYARARSADESDREGWGLGLTLVRGVAEAHGGRVSFASDAESGTTFTIELPIDARTAREDSERAAATVH
jgi:signal transduction histidine kinase